MHVTSRDTSVHQTCQADVSGRSAFATFMPAMVSLHVTAYNVLLWHGAAVLCRLLHTSWTGIQLTRRSRR